MNRIQRLVFGEVAELYDQRRPSYPAALVEDVCPRPVDALEVGAGTGKATVLFAPRVASLVAIEPSAEMAEVLAQRLGGSAGAAVSHEVVQSDFESFEPGERRFGLIYSAQAWHWVDAARRAGRAAELLAPGGVLAAFWNRPVWSPGPLRDELAAALERLEPERLAGQIARSVTEPRAEMWETWEQEAAATGALSKTRLNRYTWSVTYTTAEYLDLLRTQSPFRLLGDERMEEVLADLGAVIDRHGGSFALPHLTWLCRAWRD